jgi:hypothetical protein
VPRISDEEDGSRRAEVALLCMQPPLRGLGVTQRVSASTIASNAFPAAVARPNRRSAGRREWMGTSVCQAMVGASRAAETIEQREVRLVANWRADRMDAKAELMPQHGGQPREHLDVHVPSQLPSARYG